MLLRYFKQIQVLLNTASVSHGSNPVKHSPPLLYYEFLVLVTTINVCYKLWQNDHDQLKTMHVATIIMVLFNAKVSVNLFKHQEVHVCACMVHRLLPRL